MDTLNSLLLAPTMSEGPMERAMSTSLVVSASVRVTEIKAKARKSVGLVEHDNEHENEQFLWAYFLMIFCTLISCTLLISLAKFSKSFSSNTRNLPRTMDKAVA